jgi:hypothetical protein
MRDDGRSAASDTTRLGASARCPEDDAMLFELRRYKARPGQRDRWVAMMEQEIIPFQVSKGMVILGSFVGEEDEDTYVWIRRFEDEDEDERRELYAAVYESDHWTNVIAPRIPELIDREAIQVTRLTPTPKSALR